MEITVEYLLSWPPLSQCEGEKCGDPRERVQNLSAARPVWDSRLRNDVGKHKKNDKNGRKTLCKKFGCNFRPAEQLI